MSGVTHFERRDRAGRKKVHPSCPFCAKVYRTTPKVIFSAGGPTKYIDAFKQHLMDHLDNGRALSGIECEVGKALDAMGGFTVSVYNNC